MQLLKKIYIKLSKGSIENERSWRLMTEAHWLLYFTVFGTMTEETSRLEHDGSHRLLPLDSGRGKKRTDFDEF